MTVFHSANSSRRVDDLTAGVFARARAAGIGYGSGDSGGAPRVGGVVWNGTNGSESHRYRADPGYPAVSGASGFPDNLSSQDSLGNPSSLGEVDGGNSRRDDGNSRRDDGNSGFYQFDPSPLVNFDKARESAGRAVKVFPPPKANQRIRLAPSPRVASLVAAFLLFLAILIVGWQVVSAPPSDPIPGTIEASGELGSALKSADSSTGSNSRDSRSPSGEKDKLGDSSKDSPKLTPELFLPGSDGSEVVVYVSGQVTKPGVVHLADPARVADALEAAGGAKPEADLQVLNLARLVEDGEQIHVPLPGESLPTSVSGNGGSGANRGSSSAGSDLVNLNTADATALQTLSGIGPALAERIIDYRNSNGKFQSVDQLDEVSGIGPSLMERLRPHVTV